MPSPKENYNTLVTSGKIQPDKKQILALDKLETLYHQLINYNPHKAVGSWRGFFCKLGLGKGKCLDNFPMGLYMHGSVGVGKTVLLKSFYDSIPTDKKVYMHFHTFLLDLNKRMVDYNDKGVDDPLACIGVDIVKEAWLFCFDECVVGDVGDAMLFGRIAQVILQNGGVIVATSNFPPEKLKPRGAGADIFRPYVEYFFSRTMTHDMNSTLDYRSVKGKDGWANYLYPLNNGTRGKLQRIMDDLTYGVETAPDVLYVRGHSIALYHTGGNVACTTYIDLLAKPYGVQDFMALADKYPTLVIGGIPKIKADDTTLAKRFIVLVDAYYEVGGKIILSADCPPEELYEHGPVKFEFERCLSRLSSFNQ